VIPRARLLHFKVRDIERIHTMAFAAALTEATQRERRLASTDCCHLRVSFPRRRLRRVSDPGVARCAERPYAVHKLPRLLHHK
jgi:hypothetical protein